MNFRAARSGTGTSLLEMIAYVAIFGVVINLSVSVFVTSSRLSAFGIRALDQVGRIEEAGRVFTRAVRSSHGVSGSVGRYRTGPEQLVLQATDPSGSTTRYIVLGPIQSPSKLSKLVISEDNGGYTLESLVTYALDLGSVAFTYDAADPRDARLVTMDLTTGAATPQQTEKGLRRFNAALRGIKP